jgi:hypothetical protein
MTSATHRTEFSLGTITAVLDCPYRRKADYTFGIRTQKQNNRSEEPLPCPYYGVLPIQFAMDQSCTSRQSRAKQHQAGGLWNRAVIGIWRDCFAPGSKGPQKSLATIAPNEMQCRVNLDRTTHYL